MSPDRTSEPTWEQSDNDHGPLDTHRRALGTRRLDTFMELNARTHFMQLALVMSVSTAAAGHFEDEWLDAIKTDATDLEQQAREFAEWCRQLADAWRAARKDGE